MICEWVKNVVVRLTIDGEMTRLYKGLEFVVLEENTYIEKALEKGWAKRTGDVMSVDDGVDTAKKKVEE